MEFSLVAPPLVKIPLLVFIRWNKNRSYTEKSIFISLIKPKVEFSLVALPLVKIPLLVFIRWNKNRSYTEKVKYPLSLACDLQKEDIAVTVPRSLSSAAVVQTLHQVLWFGIISNIAQTVESLHSMEFLFRIITIIILGVPVPVH